MIFAVNLFVTVRNGPPMTLGGGDSAMVLFALRHRHFLVTMLLALITAMLTVIGITWA
jgi:hypothetical protein